MWRDRLHDDEGVALVYVLLASVIISGLVVVFMQRSLFEMRSTSAAASWESAIHVAEAGAEALFGQINGEGDTFEEKVVTEGPDPVNGVLVKHVYDPEKHLRDLYGANYEAEQKAEVLAAALRAYERDWATTLALNALEHGGPGIIETDDGHAYGIRPIKPSDDDNGENEVWDIVFGVGFVPSINHDDPTIRLVKMQINQYFFNADHALLVGGSLRFGGNASIRSNGCNPQNEHLCDADVHTNGNVTHSGNGNVNVDGTITATGSAGVNSVLGAGLSGEPSISIPDVWAKDFYGREHVATANWYDLCPDGIVRSRGSSPCDGDEVWPGTIGGTDYLGWKHVKPSGNHLAKWVGRGIESGVFYVHHGNADVTGSAGRTDVSILVSADPDKPHQTGSMEVAGNPAFDPAVSEVLFVTDGDLRLGGTGTSAADWALGGFIFVGEQLAASANITLNGAIIVADRTDVHPWVQRSNNQGSNAGAHVTGNLTLNYKREMRLNLSGRITIEYWNEL